MSSSARDPGTVGEIKGRALWRLWLWFSGRTLLSRMLLALVTVWIAFVLARLGFLGATGTQAARMIIPMDLTWLDPRPPIVPLLLSYEHGEATHPRKMGRLGEVVRSGETVVLTFMAGTDAWVTVFGLDQRGVHPVFGSGLDPLPVVANRSYARAFELDETEGLEVYFAIAASGEFEFRNVIAPRLESVRLDVPIKGPTQFPFELQLPARFTQSLVYFQHVSSVH